MEPTAKKIQDFLTPTDPIRLSFFGKQELLSGRRLPIDTSSLPERGGLYAVAFGCRGYEGPCFKKYDGDRKGALDELVERLREKVERREEIARDYEKFEIYFAKKRRDFNDFLKKLNSRDRADVPRPTAPPSAPILAAKRSRTLSNQAKLRYAVMFIAIRQSLTGLAYCRFLDDNRLHPPSTWVSDGCPRSYPDAYRAKRWQKRIQDEKHRVGRKLKEWEDHKSPELKAILGISNSHSPLASKKSNLS